MTKIRNTNAHSVTRISRPLLLSCRHFATYNKQRGDGQRKDKFSTERRDRREVNRAEERREPRQQKNSTEKRPQDYTKEQWESIQKSKEEGILQCVNESEGNVEGGGEERRGEERYI